MPATLSVVIPIFNEEKMIVQFVERVQPVDPGPEMQQELILGNACFSDGAGGRVDGRADAVYGGPPCHLGAFPFQFATCCSSSCFCCHWRC